MTQQIMTAIKAALEAGALLKSRLGSPGKVVHKGVIDLVTEMDGRAEALIVELISKTFPDHAIYIRESLHADLRI